MNIGQRTVPVPLNPNEAVLAEAYGSVGHRTGGKLVVTNQRLLFQPWDLSLAATLIKWGCKAVGMPHGEAVNYVVGKLVGIVDRTAQGVADIVDVECVGLASFLTPPKVRISTSHGDYAEFGVFATPTTPNISSRNNDVRDSLASLLRDTFL